MESFHPPKEVTEKVDDSVMPQKEGISEQWVREKIDSLIPLIKEKWPSIAHQTLETAKGNIDDLVGVIANHTGSSASGIKNQLFEIIDSIQENNWEPELILGPESRGFIFGSLLASRLGIGFIPVRKPGKLPRKAAEKFFSLEYGTNTVHIHEDAISKGDKVLVVDDLIATGGTAMATAELCQELGASEVHIIALIDLPKLGGSKKLADKFGEVITLIDY